MDKWQRGRQSERNAAKNTERNERGKTNFKYTLFSSSVANLDRQTDRQKERYAERQK